MKDENRKIHYNRRYADPAKRQQMREQQEIRARLGNNDSVAQRVVENELRRMADPHLYETIPKSSPSEYHGLWNRLSDDNTLKTAGAWALVVFCFGVLAILFEFNLKDGITLDQIETVASNTGLFITIALFFIVLKAGALVIFDRARLSTVSPIFSVLGILAGAYTIAALLFGFLSLWAIPTAILAVIWWLWTTPSPSE